MKLETWKNPVNNNRYVYVEITEDDLFTAFRLFDHIDRRCLSEWNRENASMEERFMALQLIARKLEEAVEHEPATRT